MLGDGAEVREKIRAYQFPIITIINRFSLLREGGDKVLLKDVQVLTLVNGQYTNGRRSAGVPQLKCLGGTAHCKYLPQTVQCYNRGWDGYDVQVREEREGPLSYKLL